MLELNERQLFRALGDVDDSLLEAAERLPHRKKPRHTGLWIAACLCLAALSLAAPYVALFTKGLLCRSQGRRLHPGRSRRYGSRAQGLL